jgi:microcystin-dependent protein
MQGNLGRADGTETVSLTAAMNARHAHPAGCGGTATTVNPANGYWAADPGNVVGQYTNQAGNAVMAGDAITMAGQGQPHNNIQPYLCIRYIISLEGTVPQQS